MIVGGEDNQGYSLLFYVCELCRLRHVHTYEQCLNLHIALVLGFLVFCLLGANHGGKSSKISKGNFEIKISARKGPLGLVFCMFLLAKLRSLLRIP